jgi:hypothetical protein
LFAEVAAFGGGEVSDGVGGEVGVVGAIGGHVGSVAGANDRGNCVWRREGGMVCRTRELIVEMG